MSLRTVRFGSIAVLVCTLVVPLLAQTEDAVTEQNIQQAVDSYFQPKTAALVEPGNTTDQSAQQTQDEAISLHPPLLLSRDLHQSGSEYSRLLDKVEATPKLGYDANTKIMPVRDMLSLQEQEFGFSTQHGYFRKTNFGLQDIGRGIYLFETPSSYVETATGRIYSR